jgi:hypothetical protein
VKTNEKASIGASYPANYLSLGREGDAPCPW